MKKVLTYFFVTLGVIFFVLLCALAYLWFADPFNVRPLIGVVMGDSPAAAELNADKNAALSPTQEAALEKLGIDPATLPTNVSPEMEACFTEKLGSVRVSEIKAGDAPTPVEVFTTRSCYE